MQLSPLLGVGILLIALGIVVLWRDMRRQRRVDNIDNGPGHDTATDHLPMAEVQISHPPAPGADEKFAHSVLPGFDPGSPLYELRETIERVSGEFESSEQSGSGGKSKQTVRDWKALGERIEKSISSVNSVLRKVDISIGSAGQPGWSFSNRGYGSFRRVMLADQSVAWLRLELSSNGRFICALRSHGDERSALNANETINAQVLTSDKISALIAASMQPITKYAAHNSSRMISDQDADHTIWQESEELVTVALKRAGDALLESGAVFEIGDAPEWNDMTKRHRLIVKVLLSRKHIAQMYIERPTARHIECLVVPATPEAGKRSERQRVELAKLTSTDFAELIVNCLWPAIETAWNAQQRAIRANA